MKRPRHTARPHPSATAPGPGRSRRPPRHRRPLLILSLIAMVTTLGILRAPPGAEAMSIDTPQAITGTDLQSVYGIVTDSTGASIAVGKFHGQTTFKGTYGSDVTLTEVTGYGDAFVVKYDASGQIKWTRVFTGLGIDVLGGVTVSDDDTIYVAGQTASPTLYYAGGSLAASGSSYDGFVAKIDGYGTVQWVRSVGGATGQNLSSVAVYGDMVYAVGSTMGADPFQVKGPNVALSKNSFGTPKQDNAILVGLTTGGTPKFATVQGTPDSNDAFQGVTADAAGPFVSGYWSPGSPATYGNVTFNAPAGFSRGVTAHYSTDGSFMWAEESANAMRKVAITGSHLIAVGEKAESREPNDGTLQWSHDLPGEGSALALGPFGIASFASNYYKDETVALADGTMKALPFQGGFDVAYGSLDPSTGDILTVDRLGGAGHDKAYGIGVDAAGNAVVAGFFTEKSYFGANTLTSAGDLDAFLLRVKMGPAYHGTTPYRALDTRFGVGGPATKFGPGETRGLKVTGLAGVPANASAIIANITAVNATADSYVTAWAGGSGQPDSYTVSWQAGRTTPNLALVRVGTKGYIQLYNKIGNVDLIVDIQGWFDRDGTGHRFAGLTPTRILDTRNPGQTKFGPGESRKLHIADGVPPEASAVVANVTITDATAASHLTVWPAGVAQPLASNLNFVAGQTVPNLVVVKKGSNNDISIFNNAGQVNVIVDVVGYYLEGARGSGVSVAPTRMLDTRTGVAGPPKKFGPGEIREIPIGDTYPTKSIAKSAVLQVTVMNPSDFSHLTVWPADKPQPTASNLNFTPGQTVGNLVMVKLDVTGAIKIRNNAGNTNVVVDVVAWYG